MSDQIYAPIGGSTAESWLLVEELLHRVTNEYAAAVGSISLAAARCVDINAKTTLTAAAKRLVDHADVHRALQVPVTAGLADLSRYLRRLCAAMVRASLAERMIHLTLVEEKIVLDTKQCWLVGLIASELINNSVRHGLRHGEGRIVVELSRRDGAVQCLVTDNGRSGNPAPGRGTQITKALTCQLGGRINWYFGPNGTTALLCFPLEA